MQRKAALGITAGAVAAGSTFLAFAPSTLWWKCPIYAATGLYCPGCGGQRWAHSLLTGDFEAAWNYNQLLSLTPIFLLVIWLGIKFKAPVWLRLTALGILLLIELGFMFWRNFPPQVTYLQN